MITVIHGPMKTGKTLHAESFRKHYGCARIVEDGEARVVTLRDGDLILTNRNVEQAAKTFPGATLIPIDTARVAIGLAPAPADGFAIEKVGSFYYSLVEDLEDTEFWFGPHPYRDVAITKARLGNPDLGFWTAEGKPQVNDLDPFRASMLTEDGAIGAAFADRNDHRFGEDGEGGPNHWGPEDIAELVVRLNATFADWAREHGYDRAWALDVRAEEWTPPPAAKADPQDRPKLSIAGARG